MNHSRYLLTVLALACSALTGCASSAQSTAPSASGSSTVAKTARSVTHRVRNVLCSPGQLATGSGFMLDRTTLVTNRHVVEGARRLEVTTWDGEDINVPVHAYSTVSDLAVVSTSSELSPAALTEDIRVGDSVYVSGYPRGQAWHLSEGKVVDFVKGSGVSEYGNLMRVSAPVERGNSGGPLLNERGEVVGVVFAVESESGYGLAISIKTLRAVLAAGSEALTTGSGCR